MRKKDKQSNISSSSSPFNMKSKTKPSIHSTKTHFKKLNTPEKEDRWESAKTRPYKNKKIINNNNNNNNRRRKEDIEMILRAPSIHNRISLYSSNGLAPGKKYPRLPTMESQDIRTPILGDSGNYNSLHNTNVSVTSFTSSNFPTTSENMPRSTIFEGSQLFSAHNRETLKLTALREVFGSIADDKGFMHKKDVVNVLNMPDLKDKLKDYERMDGKIDGKAILLDTCMDMEIEINDKLKFTFDLFDTNKNGTISRNEIIILLKSTLSSCKLELTGKYDYNHLVNVLFKKLNVKDSITFEQFSFIFRQYLIDAYSMNNNNNNKSNNDPNVDTDDESQGGQKSKLRYIYERKKLHIYWLLFYFCLNVGAFILKAIKYSFDPAVGYGLIIARGCAQVIMLNCFLVLLPMCRSIIATMKRNNILWKYIPFDDLLDFHKICGSVLLNAALFHTGAHIVIEIYMFILSTPYEREHSFICKHIPVFHSNHTIGKLPDFTKVLLTVPVMTGIMLLLITIISFPLAAIPRFRQGKFNIFWYSHMLFGPFLLITCIHGATSWLATAQSYIWILPPLLLYLMERRFRYAKVFTTPLKILEAKESDNTLALYIQKPKRFIYRPGMYLYLNVPSLSNHEWHPFTISSAPGDHYISVHIRNAGDWTNMLHKLIKLCQYSKEHYPDVYIDGPIGAPTEEYRRFKTIMMIAGGIGITPFASILKDIVYLWEDYRCLNCKNIKHPNHFRIQKMYFHWITRGQKSLSWFKETMNYINEMDKDNIIESHQYLSTVKENNDTTALKLFQNFIHDETGFDFVSGLKSKTTTHFGRPDWEKIFREMCISHPGEEIGVFFCGPHALDTILENLCHKYSSDSEIGGTSFEYHSEKFS